MNRSIRVLLLLLLKRISISVSLILNRGVRFISTACIEEVATLVAAMNLGLVDHLVRRSLLLWHDLSLCNTSSVSYTLNAVLGPSTTRAGILPALIIS